MFGKKNVESSMNQGDRSFVSESMQIEGDLTSPSAVDVAGLITGNVKVSEMVINETGSTKGNLHVEKLEVHGHVEGKIIVDIIYLGKSAIIKGDISFKTSLKTEAGAEIDGYISKIRKGVRKEEDIEIDEIEEKPRLGKPTLVKSNKKEVV